MDSRSIRHQYVIVFMGGVLALFMLLLFTLHITNSIKSSRIQAMREQLICLISGEAAASCLKSRLYDLIRQKRVISVHLADSGYPLLRGLLVISETADELQERARRPAPRNRRGMVLQIPYPAV
ncbi:MAG: hypothetical protein R2912_01230 [Eubacteriales bacterium]